MHNQVHLISDNVKKENKKKIKNELERFERCLLLGFTMFEFYCWFELMAIRQIASSSILDRGCYFELVGIN